MGGRSHSGGSITVVASSTGAKDCRDRAPGELVHSVEGSSNEIKNGLKSGENVESTDADSQNLWWQGL